MQYRLRHIKFRARKPPQMLGVKRSHLKNTTKNISLGYISQYILLSPPTYFGPMLRIFSFSKIMYAHLLNGFPPKTKQKKKKNCIICPIAPDKQCKQNLRCTNKTMQTKFAKFRQK